MITGNINALDAEQRARLFDRGSASGSRADVTGPVRAIIEEVRARGDAALRDLAARYDGVTLDAVEVPRAEWECALRELDPAVRTALQAAAAAIRAFHSAQLPADMELEVRPGVSLGRRADPLDSVGVYAPGGRASYPSSVLMGVVPARVAGVGSIVVCSPPGRDGLPPRAVLAACAIAQADRVFALGGAGAIAALALGTESVPAVAKIVGPGNAYVTEAKQQLNGFVAIDSPAGPSEVLVLADDTADPALAAIELLAQAEHDPDAAAVAVVIGNARRCDAILAEIERTVPLQPRKDIISASLAARGAVLYADTLDDALAFAQEYAPEHLSLMIADPRAALPRVRCAGTVFLGGASSLAFGDYMTGANHVLPTNRLARSYSGLSTLDFVRFTTYQEVSACAAAELSVPVQVLANAEGLPAHARAAALRADRAGVLPQTLRAAPAVRGAYADIELYEPGRLPCAVDLSDNTNLHGVPPAARAVLAAPAASTISRYPTVYARELKRALADRFNVDAANIVTGCGSDDLLDSLMRAFCETGDTVAYPSPTFGVVDLFARMNAARSAAVPHASGHTLDVAALAGAGGAVTYICRPNNPTGVLYSRALVDALERAVRGVLVVDEAYADYADDDVMDLALSSDRTVVVRTLSKAYGLAGLRVGFAIGPAPLVREIEKSRGPFKVGGLAEAAAIAAIRHDRGWIDGHVAEVRTARERLTQRLADEGLNPVPSQSNFVLIPVPEGGDAVAWSAALRAGGVAVRAFPGLPGTGDAIRVTVGPWPLMERFMNALGGIRPITAAGAASGS